MAKRLMVVAALLAVAAAGPAAGIADGHGKHGKHHKKAISAKVWLKAAAQSNLFEVQSGALAADRAESDVVKMIGAALVVDHTAELKRLAKLARRYDVRLPTQPNKAQRAVIATLQGLTGPEFDQAFLEAQRAAHVQAINLYKLGAFSHKKGIRIDAINALPVLGVHLGMVQLALGEKHH
jgi:putative membrane protein